MQQTSSWCSQLAADGSSSHRAISYSDYVVCVALM